MAALWATLRGEITRATATERIATRTMYGVPAAAGAAIFSGWRGDGHDYAI